MPSPSALQSALGAGRFALTAEVAPPLTASAADLLALAAPLAGLVDAVNVTDAASARPRMSSLAAAAILVRAGIEPVMQVTCRDRNRIGLQSDLLGAAALGVCNLLVLRGDDVGAGNQPEAKPVFDLDSGALIATASDLARHGRLPSGETIRPPPAFFVGAADTPLDPPPGWKPDRLRAKIDAGAQFVQTQFCFDAALLRRYAARLREEGLSARAPLLIGIGPLASARSARWMKQNLGGTIIPEATIARLDAAADPAAEGIRICTELLQELATIPGIAGAHLMAPLSLAAIPAAIRAANMAERGMPAK